MLRNIPSSGKCTTVLTAWCKDPVASACVEPRGDAALSSSRNAARSMVGDCRVALRLRTVADSRRDTAVKFHRGNVDGNGSSCRALARSTTSQPRRRHDMSADVERSSRLLPPCGARRIALRDRISIPQGGVEKQNAVKYKSTKPMMNESTMSNGPSAIETKPTQEAHNKENKATASATSLMALVGWIRKTPAAVYPVQLRGKAFPRATEKRERLQW